MTIEFVVMGEPIAKARPFIVSKGGKSWGITPVKTKKAEAVIKKEAQPFQNTIPKECFEGPITLRIAFFMPIPKSLPKKLLPFAINNELPHTKRPDCDNMVKLVKDAINGVLWKDDSQVYRLLTIKYYGLHPSTKISIVYEK